MFEDKSKINYPYEFTETTTIPLKTPSIKISKTALVHILSQLRSTIKNRCYIQKKLIIIKINKRIVMFLVMYKYFYTIHVLLKSADIQRFFIHR